MRRFLLLAAVLLLPACASVPKVAEVPVAVPCPPPAELPPLVFPLDKLRQGSPEERVRALLLVIDKLAGRVRALELQLKGYRQ